MRHVPSRSWAQRYGQLVLHSSYPENDRQVQRSQVVAFIEIVDAFRIDTISKAPTPPSAHGRVKTHWTQQFWRIIISLLCVSSSGLTFGSTELSRAKTG